jgi:hypothetical protein
MPTHEYARVNVFTADRFGGNPLAVLTDARGLTDTQMQAIAREFSLSETAFVLPPYNPQHHARVRIFTPTQELPFAGHPNVGTGFVLARAMDNPPEHLVFEEIAGLVRVHILPDQAHRITGAAIAADRRPGIDRDGRHLRQPQARRYPDSRAPSAVRVGRHRIRDRRDREPGGAVARGPRSCRVPCGVLSQISLVCEFNSASEPVYPARE